MLTHMEDAAVPEQRISNVVDQLENRVQSRTDIVLCQLLSTVVAAFLAMFQTVRSWRAASETAEVNDTGPLRFMRTLERTGMFYIQFESLLTTRKNERGMIEDLFYVIDRCMPGIELRCCRAEQDGCLGFDSDETDLFTGTRVLRVGLSAATFALMPRRLIEADGVRSVRLKVMAVLFTQGINEQQSLAHHMGEGELEDRINQHSLKRLSELFGILTRPNVTRPGPNGLEPTSIPSAEYEYEQQRAADAAAAAGGSGAVDAVDVFVPALASSEKRALHEALLQVKDAVAKADGDENKHPEVLLTAENFSALAGGARVTSCKSGKDRTGMSVTLEEWNALNLWLHQSGYQISYGSGEDRTHLRDLLRSHGVRRDNVR